jgi:hypothetical protein
VLFLIGGFTQWGIAGEPLWRRLICWGLAAAVLALLVEHGPALLKG